MQADQRSHLGPSATNAFLMTHGRLVPALNRVMKARAELRSANVRLIEAMHDARSRGMTLQAIGDVLGLTRQRVKQMLDKETS